MNSELKRLIAEAEEAETEAMAEAQEQVKMRKK